jgi:hypothetical protein
VSGVTRCPNVRLRLHVGALGLAAFLVMHGVTFPRGHLAQGMNASSATAVTMISPAHSSDSSSHGSHDTAHGDAAQACLAALMTIIAVMVVRQVVGAHAGNAQRRLQTVFSAPEPPVPRLSVRF